MPKRPRTPAEQARDEALAKLRAANRLWLIACLDRITQYPSGYEATTQDYRVGFEKDGVLPATSNKAYGALAQRAVRVGLLEYTTKRWKGPIKGCHARTLPVYRRTPQRTYALKAKT